jgi:hypothetical protein
MGNDQRRDIEAANASASAALAAGKSDSIGTRQQYLDKTLGYLQPGIDTQNQLMQALGVQGPEAQQAYFSNFQHDPSFQFGVDALDRSAASRGNLFSGGQMKALSNYGAQRFDTRINQLMQLQGNSPALAAGATQDTGGQIADTQFGYGQLVANQATNYGNSMAASRSIPINNLLSIGNIAAKAYGAK